MSKPNVDRFCEYCGGPEGEEGAGTGVCEGCYYGMRLCPEDWEAEMKKAGREVHYQGGCVPLGDGGFYCRNPYYASGSGESSDE